MLTILSTAKRFEGHFAVIQRNAITSWTLLTPKPEIILFGRDEGTAEICAELGITHVPDVATNDAGTPLLSDMFLTGQALAANDVVCWSNSDMIFTNALISVAALVAKRHRPSYVVGRRRDIDQFTPIDFDNNWQERLSAHAHATGELKPANWIDYFMFPKGLFTDLPPFAVGRPGYDPWLIWRASDLGADVIDATDFICAIHQRHDYSHVGSRAMVFSGAEARKNAEMIDDWRHYHSTAYARLKIDSDGNLVPARGFQYRTARIRTYLGHALRFTRSYRQRRLGERATTK